MSVFKGPLKSSVNAGQLSQDLLGKVGIKQYYSGAKVMKGFEPIPQSGFDLLPGSAFVDTVASALCRKAVLRVDADLSYVLVFTVGSCAIYRNDRVKVATVAIAALTADLLPDLSFYGEANTVGIFHRSVPLGWRLLRNPANDTIWTFGDWPFEDIPDVDLGGSYAKTTDIWQIFLRWATSVTFLQLTATIDGQTTVSASLLVAPDSATSGQWITFGNDIQAAISALPGLSSGVSVAWAGSTNGHSTWYSVSFTGALAGSEYDLAANIVNTSDASALSSHYQVGKTAGEPLVSVARGGFSGMELYQDRAVYYGPKSKAAALAMSQVGEYFDLDIESQQDNGARLEALRSSTSEVIRHVLDNTYLLCFTDQAEWFASSRTVKRNEPLNWVRASEIGSRQNCRPVIVEGNVYFVSPDGGRLFMISYDAVSTTYVPKSQNDLCSDLVSGIRRIATQKKTSANTSTRLWLLREDGRLLCGVLNVSQDIDFAACEWGVAGGGLVKDIAVDGQNQVWLTVDRAGAISEELLEEASANLLQSTKTVTTDLAGQATGLAIFNGKQVWAEIDGDVFGPFTVASGAVETGMPAVSARIGLWSAPLYESMPYIRVLPDDTVVRRPGAVKAAKLYVIDTTSIAVGANNRAAKTVPLNRVDDDLTLPRQGFTGHCEVLGLIGATMDPTLVITQKRPGRIRVRDYIPGVKL